MSATTARSDGDERGAVATRPAEPVEGLDDGPGEPVDDAPGAPRLADRRPARTALLILAAVGLIVAALGASVLLGGQRSDGTRIAREPIFLDYPVTMTVQGSDGPARPVYRAESAFWVLLPGGWQTTAEWRFQVPDPAGSVRLTVAGVAVEGRTEAGVFSATIPSRLISKVTTVGVAGTTATPKLAVHWNDTRLYRDGPKILQSTTPRPGLRASAWWRDHLAAAMALALLYLLVVGATAVWAFRQILAFGGRRLLYLVGGVALAVLVASTFLTNFDIQLFKGLGQRYWLYGPVPALAISGYGPLVDALFDLPTLPYVLISGGLGRQSEYALNLAIRVPFVLGLVLLVAGTCRIVRSARVRSAIKSRALFWLVLNPATLVMVFWQPEALLVALVLLSIAMLLEDRPVASGILFGLAFSGKYWPAFVGPIALVGAWRMFGRRAAARWLTASVGTTSLIFAVYWLPTLLTLRSTSVFLQLVRDRMPFFGGSGAASEATVWSLYALPRNELHGGLQRFAASVEQWSFVLVMLSALGIAAVFVAVRADRRRLLLGCGATLAVAAALNSLSTPQFALWTLPFVLAAYVEAGRPRPFVVVTLAATMVGTLVSLFIEPLSLWLLHVSHGQDVLAFRMAAWMTRNIVDLKTAKLLGFLFALFLATSAVLMVVDMLPARRPKHAKTRPVGTYAKQAGVCLVVLIAIFVLRPGLASPLLILAAGLPTFQQLRGRTGGAYLEAASLAAVALSLGLAAYTLG